MRLIRFTFLAFILLFGFAAQAQISTQGHEHDSLLIVFKDGHQQSFPVSDIARIQFDNANSAIGRGRFLGKWRVGDGVGGTFLITLDRDGNATKTIGANKGTWTVVDGEARISWNDGWHDAIRRTTKKGTEWEKAAYAPDKNFSDAPSNVASAARVDPNPI